MTHPRFVAFIGNARAAEVTPSPCIAPLMFPDHPHPDRRRPFTGTSPYPWPDSFVRPFLLRCVSDTEDLNASRQVADRPTPRLSHKELFVLEPGIECRDELAISVE